MVSNDEGTPARTVRQFLKRAWEGLRLLIPRFGSPAIVAAGCFLVSTGYAQENTAVQDPAAPVNRAIYKANTVIDHAVVRPVAKGYRTIVPGAVRRSIGNFFSNLGAPVTLANDLLQGNVHRAWNTTQRFAVNTTVGVGGLFDPATGMDLPKHRADFGQTMGVWGVPPGPVLQVPLLGPSNLRDAVGSGVDGVVSPWDFAPKDDAINIAKYSTSGLKMVDGRSRKLGEDIVSPETPADPYIAARDRHARQRAEFVAEGAQGIAAADAP